MLPDNIRENLYSGEVSSVTLKETAEEFNRAYPDVAKSVELATKALGEAFKSITSGLADFINALWESCLNIQNQIKNYPNRRVVHLALHGRTERIRKKNTNRILRDLKKK